MNKRKTRHYRPDKLRFIRNTFIIVLIIPLFYCGAEKHGLEEKLRNEIIRLYPEAREDIIDAFFSINRGFLLDEKKLHELYKIKTHAIDYNQIASDPLLNIIMAQELNLNPRTRVLEIGTGSGIQAALLSKLCAEVFSIEISFRLMCRAKDRLYRLGYRNIEIAHGDGFFGWPDKSKRFDRILVTCSYHNVPPALAAQLSEGGILLIPMGPPFGKQKLTRFKKKSGKLVKDSVIRDVVFRPMLNH